MHQLSVTAGGNTAAKSTFPGIPQLSQVAEKDRDRRERLTWSGSEESSPQPQDHTLVLGGGGRSAVCQGDSMGGLAAELMQPSLASLHWSAEAASDGQQEEVFNAIFILTLTAGSPKVTESCLRPWPETDPQLEKRNHTE